MEKATRQHTKEHNRALVLRTIVTNNSISRAEIARITRLTRTTVSDIVSDLMAEGLVSEVGVGTSLGGKNPILLSLVDDARFLIGLDLAQREFLGAVFNLRGKIRFMTRQPVNNRSGKEALSAIYEILDCLVKTSYQPIMGIGIGTPGLVNTSEGVVVTAVNLDWQNLPLASLLEERYHLPVYVLNDSQAAAMGEYNYGEGHQEENNMIVINARQGIGAGLIVGRQLFQGDGGFSGEIGHIVVVPQGGQRCRCGKFGCLETVASTRALIQQARELAIHNQGIFQEAEEIDFAAILRVFEQGDHRVQQMVLDTARHMGFAISSLIGTLNIHKIVLTGDITRFGKPWLDVVRDTVSQNTLSMLAGNTRVEFGQMGENSVILGASAMLADNSPLFFDAR